MSKEADQLRALMESLVPEGAKEYEDIVKEDWGSSDWYSVINSMDKHIDKYGLSPDTIMDAARNAAEFWGDMMGHDMSTRDGEQDAIEDCKAGWLRMSKRGQDLQKMFAPKEPEPKKDYDPADHGIERLGIPQESIGEDVTEGGFSLEVEADMESNDDLVTIIQSGHPVASMSGDDFRKLVREYKRSQHRP